MVIGRLKQFAKKSKTIVIAYHIWDDYRTKRKFLKGNFESASGSTHKQFAISDSLKYIDNVFNDYLKYSGLSTEDIQGKKILEIGPGDNFGVALKFLVNGAEQVVSLDKFFSERDPKQQLQIYEAMREGLNDQQKYIFDEVISFGDTIEFNAKKLKYIYGHGIEEAGGMFEAESSDFIVSRAVVEHLYDTDTAFQVMNNLLIKGGYMLHKIDLRDHGLFTEGGMHPLTFLTIPDPIYKLMTYNCGKPNRRLVNYYKHKMEELGYGMKIFVTHLIGREEELIPHKETLEFNADYSTSTISILQQIRPKLIRRFKNVPDEELMIAGIFLITKKL